MKILAYDTENTPIIYTGYGLYNQNHYYKSIIEDWKFICASWQWVGKKEITTETWKPTTKEKSPFLQRCDRTLTKALRKAIIEADVLLAHNGDKFDFKKFNTRCLMHGLDPVPKKPSIDTLKIARNKFAFTSNKLDFLTRELKLSRKMEVEGDLWVKIIKGEEGALEKMVKYNRQDLPPLIDLYLKIRPYMDNHPSEKNHSCDKCGGSLKKQGTKLTKAGRRQQYQCLSCGGWATRELI